MEVLVNGQRLRLSQKDVIGVGGEGTVYKHASLAIKIWHQLDQNRSSKLEAFLAKHWTLPLDRVAAPIHLVYDSTGQKILGPAMPFLGQGFEEVTSLANKKYRASFLVNNKMVANIFLDGGSTIKTIHPNGLVMGDSNDLNALFRNQEMLFIDVDAWQFDHFPCPVATEQFLVPELYGINLSLKPVFKPEYDWYSYAVMLFKSLLLTHPYGGIHKDYKQLTTRAARRITVFDSGVTYPKIAFTPDILNDDLLDAFDKIFSKGQRGMFPLETLKAYTDSLVECKSCNTYYPNSKRSCPVCSAATLIIISRPTTVTKGITVTEFIKTNGPIVFHKLIGTTIYLIAYESGKAVLYCKRGSGPVTRNELFNEMPGARYEVVGDILVVNPPGKTQLLLLDTTTNPLQPIAKSETSLFTVNRRPIFRASSRFIFRIVSDSLLYGEMVDGRFVEYTLRQVIDQLTWFNVKTDDFSDRPTAFGFFQMLEKQLYWLVWEGRIYDNLSLSPLDPGESLLDLTVRYSSQSIFIRRLTQHLGVNYLRTEILDPQGQVTYSPSRLPAEDHPAAGLHGLAYSTGKLLHATDDGVLQEDVQSGNSKTFTTTKGHVQEGDALYSYKGGLLVVKDNLVTHLVLS